MVPVSVFKAYLAKTIISARSPFRVADGILPRYDPLDDVEGDVDFADEHVLIATSGLSDVPSTQLTFELRAKFQRKKSFHRIISKKFLAPKTKCSQGDKMWPISAKKKAIRPYHIIGNVLATKTKCSPGKKCSR